MYSSSSLDSSIIPTFRDIANLIECVAMYNFIKGLLVFRIVTEPCADRLTQKIHKLADFDVSAGLWTLCSDD
ncbi:MAG: hypothetical protein J6B44_08975 [Muribaculaceae bacterium]|nr:hypothetical protein [Muribaculaceae bacterium]